MLDVCCTKLAGSIFSLPCISSSPFFSLEADISLGAVIESPASRSRESRGTSLLRIDRLGMVLVIVLAFPTAHDSAEFPDEDVFLIPEVEAGDPVSHLEICLLTRGVVGEHRYSPEFKDSDRSSRSSFFFLLP